MLSSRRSGRQEREDCETSRRHRSSYSRFDASSLATVRELLKEVRRLEDDDNEDLVMRLEKLLDENATLRRELGYRSDAQVPGSDFTETRAKQTPRSNRHRRAWEDLDERESTQASLRIRSAGQRSTKSTASSGRNVKYVENSDSGGEDAYRKGSSERKSSNGSSHVVAFERTGDVITVPVTGVMRPSRSRVSTPFLSEESVNKITNTVADPPEVRGESEESSGEQAGITVNFDQDVHVLKVPLPDNARSVRGRIATPFIKDKEMPEVKTAA